MRTLIKRGPLIGFNPKVYIGNRVTTVHADEWGVADDHYNFYEYVRVRPKGGFPRWVKLYKILDAEDRKGIFSVIVHAGGHMK